MYSYTKIDNHFFKVKHFDLDNSEVELYINSDEQYQYTIQKYMHTIRNSKKNYVFDSFLVEDYKIKEVLNNSYLKRINNDNTFWTLGVDYSTSIIGDTYKLTIEEQNYLKSLDTTLKYNL